MPTATAKDSSTKTKTKTNGALIDKTALIAIAVGSVAIIYVVLMPLLKVTENPDLAWSQSSTLARASPVDVIEAPPAEKIAQEFVNRQVPAILKNSFVQQWPAFKKWSWEYLAQHVQSANAYIQNEPLNLHWLENTKLEQILQLKSEHRILAVSGTDLFRRVNQSASHPIKDYCYWSSRLDYIQAISNDVIGKPLSIAPDQQFLGNIWVSSKGLIVQAHYDMYSNFLCQVKGRKKIMLFPPSDWHGLYLYPKHHPNARRSQVNILNPNLTKHPLFASTHPVVTVLEEGDVLYIPPFWFHHIESLDPSMSVNVFSFTDEISRAAHGYNHRPQISAQWPIQLKVQATRKFLSKIAEQVLPAAADSVKSFSQQLIASRLDVLVLTPEKRSKLLVEQVDCSSELQENLKASLISFEKSSEQAIQQVVSLFSAVPTTLQAILLEDYVQDIVELTIGSQFLISFLQECLY